MDKLKTFEEFLNESKISQSIIDEYQSLGAASVDHDLQWITLKFTKEDEAKNALVKIEKMGIKNPTLAKDTHKTNDNPWEIMFRNK